MSLSVFYLVEFLALAKLNFSHLREHNLQGLSAAASFGGGETKRGVLCRRGTENPDIWAEGKGFSVLLVMKVKEMEN